MDSLRFLRIRVYSPLSLSIYLHKFVIWSEQFGLSILFFFPFVSHFGLSFIVIGSVSKKKEEKRKRNTSYQTMLNCLFIRFRFCVDFFFIVRDLIKVEFYTNWNLICFQCILLLFCLERMSNILRLCVSACV